MSADLIDLVHQLGQPRVLVVGDLMLDRYVWGDAERISQEAPVILLHADKREERLGGASSVATMLRALGAEVTLAGVVGNNVDAGRIRQLLRELNVDDSCVIPDSERPSTVKERYIGRAQHRHPQQMIRVDYEIREPVSGNVERQILHAIDEKLAQTDIVLISDYDKGVCTPGVLQSIIQSAASRELRTVADPIRGKDYRKYNGCSAMTPNRLEAGLATDRVIRTNEEALAAADKLLGTLRMEAAIITLDKDGMALVHRDGRRQVFPTRPRQVYDITGAGDMVMSVLGIALAAGLDYDPAIRLANIAGGLEVEKIGVATVTREEILQDLARSTTGGDLKIVTLDQLRRELQIRRQSGQRIAFTNGCFDVLHSGHVQYLRDARSQADVLVVGLNSDASIRALKGPSRPVNRLEDRANVLAGLQVVDYVVTFEEATPISLIHCVRPNVLVKGADYRKEDVVGSELVESYGGRVYLAPLKQGYSTTGVLKLLGAA